MDLEKYGMTIDERVADEMVRAREIVAVILDYGVSQEQIIRIIKLLGLELVNNEDSKKIVSAVKSIEECSSSKIII